MSLSDEPRSEKTQSDRALSDRARSEKALSDGPNSLRLDLLADFWKKLQAIHQVANE